MKTASQVCQSLGAGWNLPTISQANAATNSARNVKADRLLSARYSGVLTSSDHASDPTTLITTMQWSSAVFAFINKGAPAPLFCVKP